VPLPRINPSLHSLIRFSGFFRHFQSLRRHANCQSAGNPMYATAGSVRNISQPPSMRRTTSVPHLEQNPRKIKSPPSIVPRKLTIVVLLGAPPTPDVSQQSFANVFRNSLPKVLRSVTKVISVITVLVTFFLFRCSRIHSRLEIGYSRTGFCVLHRIWQRSADSIHNETRT